MEAANRMSAQDSPKLPPPIVAMYLACGTAIATLVPVVLHQSGLLAHLPDPPGSFFDSEGITESKAAHPFGVPDGLLGLASYGTTFALMLAARESEKARGLLAAKLVADGSAAAFNVVRQVVQFRKICSWCTGTAIATGVMLFAARGLLRDGAQRATQVVTREEQ